MQGNEEKLAELILYVAIESEGDPRYGATKLNKLLFYSDFLAFRRFGKAITSVAYQKLEHGPAPRRLLPVCTALESGGYIAYRETDRFGHPQKRLLALRSPNLDIFSAREIDLIQSLVKLFWGLSASEISDLSHEFIGWQVANEGENIPYELALVEFSQVTKEDLAKSREIADELQHLKAS